MDDSRREVSVLARDDARPADVGANPRFPAQAQSAAQSSINRQGNVIGNNCDALQAKESVGFAFVVDDSRPNLQIR